MRSIVVAAALAAAAGCAPQPAPAPRAEGPQAARQCFHSGNVNGFNEVDEDTVDLTVGVNEVYRVELMGVCDIEWATAIGVQSRGGSSFVCSGHDIDIITRTPGLGPQRCTARTFRRLTPAEVEAARNAR